MVALVLVLRNAIPVHLAAVAHDHVLEVDALAAVGVVGVYADGLPRPFTAESQVAPCADGAMPAAALAADDRVELGERESRERIVLVHEDDERIGLARRVEAAVHQLEARELVLLGAREPVVVGDIVLAAHEGDVGVAGVKARHGGIRAHQLRFDLRARMKAREALGPRLHDARRGKPASAASTVSAARSAVIGASSAARRRGRARAASSARPRSPLPAPRGSAGSAGTP